MREIDEPMTGVKVVHDVRIPTSDPSSTLSADLYLPDSGAIVPALVTVLPYRKDLAGSDASYRWFARRGYACVLVNHAGVGSSDGSPHPPWSPGETDDAVAAVVWAADQPWCTGDVGVWGTSHGGFTAMATACRDVPPLKAIIAMEHALDVERDIMHPGGARADFLRIGSWGGRMLLQQLLPPLRNHTSLDEQRRWWRRLHDTEPYLVELARMGPGDPRWRERSIDPTSVAVPTLSVGGWYDPFADAVPRAYEQLTVPKKLIMGPWGHVMPHESPTDPIDFLAIALRWWNHWLRGIDDGFLDEPPVLVHVQGHDSGWQTFDDWPPGKTTLAFRAGPGGVLVASPDTTAPAATIAVYHPDPTPGALSGLRGVAGRVTQPLDQHGDDLRGLYFTSEPLAADILLCGRAEVLILTDETAEAPQRFVVRLTDVDPDGRSTLIADGIHRPDGSTTEHELMLSAAAYRLRAGHRVRLVIGDSDFPRITPLPRPSAFHVTGVSVSLTELGDIQESPAQPPSLASGPAERWQHHSGWTITRDPIADSVEIRTSSETGPVHTQDGHLLDTSSTIRALVRRDSPAATVLSARHTGTARLTSGETVVCRVTLRCTQTSLDVHAVLRIDDLTTYNNTWNIPLASEA